MHHADPLVIAGIAALGISCQWLAWKWRIPAIIPLLAVGFLLGPILEWLHPRELVGDLFFPIISLSVALILFEGALTLEWKEIRHLQKVVRNLITTGALVTWALSSIATHWIVGLSWPLAILFGALIIVTGPTVIGPLLRNVRPTRQIASILKWEGILIDPIGALVAVVVFDVIVAEGPVGGWHLPALWAFLHIVGVGLSVGLSAGWVTARALKRHLVPDFLRDVFVLAVVLLAFGFSDALRSESGLLAVTIMGVCLANAGLPQLHEVWHFKERISILLISALFILLAANITRAELIYLSWESLVLLLFVIFIVRPLSVWVSTLGSSLSTQERLFLAWVAPRGIVAASVSSLFGLRLQEMGYKEANLLAPLTFLIIVGTVLLHGSTAKPLARRLGVAEEEPQGFLMLGANRFARLLAQRLQQQGFRTLLVDTNRHAVHLAHQQGLNVFHGNLLSPVVQDELDLSGIGRLLALTSNDEANALACVQFQSLFGHQEVYQLPPDFKELGETAPSYARGVMGRVLFDSRATFDWLDDMLEKGAYIEEIAITESYTYEEFLAEQGDQALPLLAFQEKRVIINTVESPFQVPVGWQLLALALPET